ncbi:MAG: hypothetical protein HYR66_01480 [Sphingobacteriales bacterium]|nr:hypothetical protein [Sphingobacteriales bacterium]
MNRIVKIFSGTTFDFALVVFLYFVARLLRFFVGNFFHHSDEGNIPYTFYSLWILLLFLIPYFILTKRGLAQEKFLGFLFIVYFAGSLSSALTRWLIHYLPKVDNIEIIKSNFIGVAGQTALAAGYNPKYIPNYNCCNLSSDKLELYFTVGPLVMIEALIEAIKDALLVLVVLIIYRIRNKPMFFENFAALKKYMTEDIYKDKPNSKSYRSYSNYDNY